jgi:tetratricopeptide (TPR) repeat protein
MTPNSRRRIPALQMRTHCLAQNPNKVIKRQQAMEKARAAALKAVGIDDTLAEAHTSLAFVYWHYDWNWPAAEREFRRALELNPSYATAHQWYAFYLLSQGKMNESLEEIGNAQRMDPLSLIINTDMAQLFLYAKRYRDAQELANKVVEMDPRFAVARAILSWSLLEQHQYVKAVDEAKKAFAISADPDTETVLAITCAAVGDKVTAREHLGRVTRSRTDPVSVGIAQAEALLGQKDEAFATLEEAMQSRNGGLTLLRVVPY